MKFDLSDLLELDFEDKELAEIAAMLPGNYNCLEQVRRENKAFHRASVQMNIVPVQIGGISQHGYTFYLEQATYESLDKPYRQRVYLVARDKRGNALNRIFDITEPARFYGACKNRALLSGLTADLLREAKGCDVIWTRLGPEHFRGVAGEGGSCRTTYGGATHITVGIDMTGDVLKTLDQGFNDEGVLIFGPSTEEGPYEFRRQVSDVSS